jgi:hypothetical protein
VDEELNLLYKYDMIYLLRSVMRAIIRSVSLAFDWKICKLRANYWITPLGIDKATKNSHCVGMDI